MSSPAPKRNAAATRIRILDAAQHVFAEKGYSQAGLREIGERAGVVSSLLVKYYRTKANLFEHALIASLDGALLLREKAEFGERLMRSVLDPAANITAPAMIALSLGDDEARDISARIVRERIVGPVADWLGTPDGPSRAASVLLLSVGFAIFHRYMEILSAPAKRSTRKLTRCASGR